MRRLVTVTGFGAGDSRGHGGFVYDALMFPLALKRIYDDKDVQEQMIRASVLDWTIARPGLLTGGAATGRMRVLADKAHARVRAGRRRVEHDRDVVEARHLHETVDALSGHRHAQTPGARKAVRIGIDADEPSPAR